MSRRLLACRAGERVIVGSVEGSAARIDKLASVGILPGVELRVQQTRPVVVVEADETVLALERELAFEVIVVEASLDEFPGAPAMVTARLARALAATCLLALIHCSPASAPDAPPIAAVHRSQCGRCHSPPPPGSHSRAQVESAATRHSHRVRLTRDEWTAMIEYLSPESSPLPESN